MHRALSLWARLASQQANVFSYSLAQLVRASAQTRSGSGPRGMERVSGNPISTIMGAIQTAVEHVAHTGDGLKHVVNQCGAPASLSLSNSSYTCGRGCDDSKFVICSRHVHASRCWLHDSITLKVVKLAILFPAVANSSHTSVGRTERIFSGLRTRCCAGCRLGLGGCRLGKGNEPEELGGYRLVSQDSLGITRARLARQRENQRMALLNKINSMQARGWQPRASQLPVRARVWCMQAFTRLCKCFSL